MSWKRTKAKKALIEIFPIISSEEMIFNYKEVEDKIQIRYTFQQTVIDKKDIDKYLSPLNEEVSPELSIYLDESYKKTQKQKI
jgi:hypothetical protein